MSLFTTKKHLLITLLISANSQFVMANAISCTSVLKSTSFKNNPEKVLSLKINGQWRPSTGTIYQAFRANAPHFWNWLNIQRSSSKQNSILLYNGVVSGDPHLTNFADIMLRNGEHKLGLIDIDDSGNASFIGDFIRFAVGNQIAVFKIDLDRLWQAYVEGLNGNKTDKPELVREIEKKSLSDFLNKQQNLLNKLTNGGKFSGNAELSEIANAPENIKKLFADSKSTFLNELANFKILDSGYKIKSEGGSQGLVRFWFLVEKDNVQHIIEFKQETDPATSLYSQQDDVFNRFKDVNNIYRTSDLPYGIFKFVKTQDNIFLMRERVHFYIKFDESLNIDNQNLRDAQEVSEYIANKLGRWQIKQTSAAGLVKEINQNPNETRKMVYELINKYILLIKELHGSK